MTYLLSADRNLRATSSYTLHQYKHSHVITRGYEAVLTVLYVLCNMSHVISILVGVKNAATKNRQYFCFIFSTFLQDVSFGLPHCAVRRISLLVKWSLATNYQNSRTHITQHCSVWFGVIYVHWWKNWACFLSPLYLHRLIYKFLYICNNDSRFQNDRYDLTFNYYCSFDKFDDSLLK